MIKNYITVAFRNFARNKVFSIINVIGLSVGISAALVIFLIVQYDFSFDKFEKDHNRIYQVAEKYTLKVSGESNGSAVTPDPLGKAVQDEVTGLDAVAAMRPADDATVSVPGNNTNKKLVFGKQKNIVFTTPNYFNLVGYTWLAGNRAAALQQPYQAVLTQSNAQLYFPGLSPNDVIGKTLLFDDTVPTTVVGVVNDITENTVFNYHIFLSRITLDATSLKPSFWDRWDHASASLLFVKLGNGATTANINKQIASLFAKYNKPNYEDAVRRTFDLRPLGDVHFKGFYDSRTAGLADKNILYGLLAIAVFLLLLACINFINLSTAQASKRAKEIGIRKTMGGLQKQLIAQFMCETFLLVVVATGLSVIITPMLLKAFASFIPQGLQANVLSQPVTLSFLTLLVIIVTVLAGLYPAAVLSSGKPILVLKNQAHSNTGETRGAWLRKGLTVWQFVIAQVFVIAVLLVSKQISYMLNKDIGMRKDAIVYVSIDRDGPTDKKHELLSKVAAIPGVAMASLSMDPPSSNSTWIDAMTYEDNNKKIKTDVQVKIGDSNYIKLYQLKLLAGNNLVNNDTIGNLLINETYLHALGLTNPQQIIGRYIDVYGKKRVVGVVQDFNQKSLHETITPLLITGGVASEATISVALQPENENGTGWKTTLNNMQQAFKQVYPGKDFDYTFLDNALAANYALEQNVVTLLQWSAALMIFISCLGLLGLVMYVTNQRTKEIGIRKVLGATATQLVALLSKDFLKLVMVAFLVAVPVAWWCAGVWLQNFAYKTSLNWWVFASGGIIMLLVAFLVLSIRTIQAALANPVKALKDE